MKQWINLVRGDTLCIKIKIKDLSVNLDSAFFSCKKNINDNNYIFKKSLGNGIEKIAEDENSKTYRIVASSDDTKNLSPGEYSFDVEITVGDTVRTPYFGTLNIIADVTRN